MYKKPDTDNKRHVTCPWCGYENKDSWELNHESQDDTECGRCEKEFEYLATITVTWATWKRAGEVTGDE